MSKTQQPQTKGKKFPDDTNPDTLTDEELVLWEQQQEEKKILLNLLKDFSNILNDKDSSDVTFLVGDQIENNDELKPLYCHKAILSSRCAPFKSMFFLGWSEGTKKEIKIPNINYDIFYSFIRYLYIGKAEVNDKNVIKLLQAADQFNIFSLRSCCYDFIVKSLTKDTVAKMILDAQAGKFQFDCDELIKSCISFVDKHTSDVVKNPKFYEFSEKTMLEMLKSSKLSIDEIDLFKATIRWGNYRRRDLDCQTPLKEIVKDLIPHIRFGLLSGPELVNIVKPCNVLDDETYYKALVYVTAPSTVKVDPNDLFYKERGSSSKFIWVNYRTTGMFEIDKKNKRRVTKIGSSNWNTCFVFGSVGYKSGKMYWEIKIEKTASGSGIYFGVTENKDTSSYSADICASCSGSKYNCTGGTIYASSGQTVGVKLDFKDQKIYFYHNGSKSTIEGILQKGKTYWPVLHCYYQNDVFELVFPKKMPK